MKSETPPKVRTKKTRSFAGVVRERLAVHEEIIHSTIEIHQRP